MASYEKYLAAGKNEPSVLFHYAVGPTRKSAMDDQMMLFHYLMGAAYKELGDKKKSAAQLSKVIAENENYLDAKEMLQQLGIPAGGQ